MFTSVGSTYDRWYTASWPRQREGICLALSGSANLFSSVTCYAATNLVPEGCCNSVWPGNCKSAEVYSYLKIVISGQFIRIEQ